MASLELSSMDSFSKLATSTALFYLNGARIELKLLNGNIVDPDATLLSIVPTQYGAIFTQLGWMPSNTIRFMGFVICISLFLLSFILSIVFTVYRTVLHPVQLCN
jgi:hypothetical protein